jgi:hypothetical protein
MIGGQGLSGPPCAARGSLEQDNPPGLVVQRMCRWCGRVTARIDDDGWASCGGSVLADASVNVPRYREPGVTL